MIKYLKAICISGAFLATIGTAHAADVASGMTLTSTSFSDGDLIDRKYAAKGGPRKCDGENVSPALSWSKPPEGTKTYAIYSYDAVGRHGLGVVHWVLYDIPADVTGFGEGEVPEGSRSGKNITTKLGYLGPCPDVGDVPHHYEFMLVALSVEPGKLPAEMTGAEFMASIQDYALGATSFVVRYARNP